MPARSKPRKPATLKPAQSPAAKQPTKPRSKPRRTAKRVSLSGLDKVHCGDCVDILKTLPNASVDLVFADPPYNLQLDGDLMRPNNTRVDGVDDAWDKFDSFKTYDAFSKGWLNECRRILKPDGAMWVIGSYHNIFRLGTVLQDLDYWILNDVIWRKVNPMPNFRGRRLTNAHETLIWAARGQKSRYTFNYESLKALNDDLQMRSDWLFPICAGPERLKDADGRKVHPTQKPEALITRVLLATTNQGDTVLDPFFGTGTTGACAKRLDRRYIGIERDPDYARIATERIGQIERLGTSTLMTARSKRAEPRVAFGKIIELGIIKPGSALYDPRRKLRAEVRADGTLAVEGGAQGSIHRLGAEVQGKTACNGWTFWHYDVGGKLTPIDELRDVAKRHLGLVPKQTLVAAE